MSKYLSRAVILETQDYKTDEVEVPEWGGVVLVRELTAAQVQRLGFGMATPDGEVDPTKDQALMTRIVSWGVIGDNGERLFSEKDIEKLGEKSYAVIQRISAVIMGLSNLAPEEEGEEEPKNE